MPKKDPTYGRIDNHPFPQGNGNQKTYDVMCQ